MSAKLKPHYEAIDPDSIDWTRNAEQKYVCTITPKNLNITWGNDARYWYLPKDSQNEVNGAATLKQISWLEVTGDVRLPMKYGGGGDGLRFRIIFKVSLTANSFGWSNAPVFVMVKYGRKGHTTWKRIRSLAVRHKDKSPSSSSNPFDIPDPETDGGSLEITLDDMSSFRFNQLYFGLYEVWSAKWKGGLQIHEVRVQQL